MSIMEASPTKEFDLFRGVSQRVMSEIGKNSEEIVIEKDSVIFRTDEEALYIYELVEGEVDIVLLERENMHYTMTRPGEIFGWSALVEPYVYTATARCSEGAKVIRVSRDTIEDVIKRHPAEGLFIYKHLTGIVAQRLRNAYQHIYRQ
ncbi:MAG: Crp/Fnr family transcriptional regulator [Proteobacteria bacterium]|nr:Crp/Fnr family transcriptional regulator [Pseudomonadota bacterium]